VYEYIQFLKGQPESAAPITRLTEQIDKAVRESMRGSPKEAVEPAVRRAVRDVVFLVKLHLQVNFTVMSELKAWRMTQAALAASLDSLRKEILFRNVIVDMANQVNFQTPYPLEPETAAAVDAAIRNHVYTWERLEDDGVVHDWLWDYLIKNRAKALPIDSYTYHDGQCCPTVTQKNEKEVMECFSDVIQFGLFRSGKDYTNGLAGVTDAEYNRHYGLIVSAVRELVDSGQVRAGISVSLDTVPIPFLGEAPLVDGEWLDKHVRTYAFENFK
jgi:hypothetical protein